jgi:hypothetical protein
VDDGDGGRRIGRAAERGLEDLAQPGEVVDRGGSVRRRRVADGRAADAGPHAGGRGFTHRADRRRRPHAAGVAQLGPTGAVEQDVVGRHATMAQACAVQHAEGVGDPGRHRDGLEHAERTTGRARREVSAVEVLHHRVGEPARRHAGGEDVDQRRVGRHRQRRREHRAPPDAAVDAHRDRTAGRLLDAAIDGAAWAAADRDQVLAARDLHVPPVDRTVTGTATERCTPARSPRVATDRRMACPFPDRPVAAVAPLRTVRPYDT